MRGERSAARAAADQAERGEPGGEYGQGGGGGYLGDDRFGVVIGDRHRPAHPRGARAQIRLEAGIGQRRVQGGLEVEIECAGADKQVLVKGEICRTADGDPAGIARNLVVVPEVEGRRPGDGGAAEREGGLDREVAAEGLRGEVLIRQAAARQARAGAVQVEVIGRERGGPGRGAGVPEIADQIDPEVILDLHEIKGAERRIELLHAGAIAGQGVRYGNDGGLRRCRRHCRRHGDPCGDGGCAQRAAD